MLNKAAQWAVNMLNCLVSGWQVIVECMKLQI